MFMPTQTKPKALSKQSSKDLTGPGGNLQESSSSIGHEILFEFKNRTIELISPKFYFAQL